MDEVPTPNYANFSAYIAACMNQPRTQAPSDLHPHNPSRPDASQPYFLDVVREANQKEQP